MAACAGDDPDAQHRGADRPAGEDHAGRRGAPAVQAGRHARHAAGAGRPDRRRRAALHAGALPGRLAADPRRRRDHAAGQRQPGVLRAVRARADCRRSCATPPTSASTRRVDAFDPALLDPREGGRRCCGRSPSSRGWSPPRRSCASRTGSRATSRTPRRRSTSSTTPAGCCRRATRSSPSCTAPGWCSSSATRTVLANGLDLLGVTAPERM